MCICIYNTSHTYTHIHTNIRYDIAVERMSLPEQSRRTDISRETAGDSRTAKNIITAIKNNCDEYFVKKRYIADDKMNIFARETLNISTSGIINANFDIAGIPFF